MDSQLLARSRLNLIDGLLPQIPGPRLVRLGADLASLRLERPSIKLTNQLEQAIEAKDTMR
jgi:hypothetical protein